ncbi:MAG: hypothetical protein J6J64_00960 [Alistipes sp.]|uniref:hypothetical protein n=1 Tax=Alistipes sp. TaxID=1872444 RepID=UPI001B75A41F|nr:hypothetical protein [Alistipes sp.]
MKKLYLTLVCLSVAFVAMAEEPEGDAIVTYDVESDEVLTPNEARKLRGFSTDINFVPRGQWIFGGTASYSAHQNVDYKLAIVDNINSEGYTVKVSPMIAYAPWKNMAVGLRFGYGRSLLALDSAALSFGDEESGINLSVDYFHQLKHSYTGTIFWRPYIPLGRSNRFAIFAEVQLNMTGSQSKIVAEDGVVDQYQNYRGTYSESIGGSVALQPGIVAFITNNTALELSIGVFGIGYERTTQLKNQIEEAVVESSNMNFKVNLLSIGFGVSFYL